MQTKMNADIYRELNAVILLDCLENYSHNCKTQLHHIKHRWKITGLRKKNPWVDLIKNEMKRQRASRPNTCQKDEDEVKQKY